VAEHPLGGALIRPCLGQLIDTDAHRPHVVDELASGGRVERLHPRIPYVDMVPPTTAEDDLCLLEPERLIDEHEQIAHRILRGLEHRGRAGLRGVDPGEVVRVDVEDQVRPLPPLLAHLIGARFAVPRSREVHVLGGGLGEEAPQVADVEDRTVTDHPGGPTGEGDVAPLAVLGPRWQADRRLPVVVGEAACEVPPRPVVHTQSIHGADLAVLTGGTAQNTYSRLA
jgi:hypothetical protein